MAKNYSFIEHTADVGIKVWGKTVNSLFVNAAQAMFEIILGKRHIPKNVGQGFSLAKTSNIIILSAPTLEDLLVVWLNELIYRFNVNKLVPVKISGLKISSPLMGEDEGEGGKHKMSAEIFTEKFDSIKHHIDTDIKSTTYHQLKIIKNRGRYITQIIFDV